MYFLSVFVWLSIRVFSWKMVELNWLRIVRIGFCNDKMGKSFPNKFTSDNLSNVWFIICRAKFMFAMLYFPYGWIVTFWSCGSNRVNLKLTLQVSKQFWQEKVWDEKTILRIFILWQTVRSCMYIRRPKLMNHLMYCEPKVAMHWHYKCQWWE